jgi:hypothetical protein
LPQNEKIAQKMLKVAKSHNKRAKMGLNSVFGHFLDVLVMTKKCTKTNIFVTSQKSGRTPTLSLKIQEGPPAPPLPKLTYAWGRDALFGASG